jgi:hypothetical protein
MISETQEKINSCDLEFQTRASGEVLQEHECQAADTLLGSCRGTWQLFCVLLTKQGL